MFISKHGERLQFNNGHFPRRLVAERMRSIFAWFGGKQEERPACLQTTNANIF
ncbi:MAG: hypothetical protein O7D30_12160 [Rickettsia endosymbiont of Ixodes persulcatus]|nr:hypothetical protein [Rickettsia endosymbiont of Ixodes persulcatus]